MKTMILGLPQSGQQELFSLLTGIPLETIILKPLESHQGICEVKDPRVTRLSELYKPKKTTYSRIDYLLVPDNKFLKNADVICWITREESGISEFLSDLIINDMMLVEKRLESIEKEQKKKFAGLREKEKQLMEKCKKHLENEQLLQKLELTGEELKTAKTYQFLTLKPVILVMNIPESKIIEEKHGLPCIQVSAELEKEIKSLNPEDQAAFMKELGIEESALDKMARATFKALGLISFFTVGADEVRAWPVRAGLTAPEAGSTIHSDIERGFVKAEMMKYDDLLALGSEEKVKQAGKYYLKGRDYIVCDGDILNFRFNV